MNNRRMRSLWWAFALLAFALAFACGGDDDDGNGVPSGDDVDDDADDDEGDDDVDDDEMDDDTWPDDDTGVDDDDDSPPADPGLPGSSATAFQDLTWPEPITGRDQPARVYYPTSDGGASIDLTEGWRPVVIFAPGFSATPSWYYSYGEHLASYGFVVVYRANYVVSHQDLADSTTALINWLEQQFVTGGSLFENAIDRERIGTSGHSMGGKVSLLTAYQDDRVTASGVVDPVDTSPLPTPSFPSVTPELMPSIAIPTLLIGGSDGGACAPANDNYHQYFEYANAPSVEVTILNSGHVTFCDLPDGVIDIAGLICPTGGGDYDEIKFLARRYLTAFYMSVLQDDTSYDYWLTGEGMAIDVADGLAETQVKF